MHLNTFYQRNNLHMMGTAESATLSLTGWEAELFLHLLLLPLFFSLHPSPCVLLPSPASPLLVPAFTNKYKCLWLASLQHRCMFVAREGLFINFQPWKVQRAMNGRVQITHTDKWTHRLLMYHCKAAASTSFGRGSWGHVCACVCMLPKAGQRAGAHTCKHTQGLRGVVGGSFHWMQL